MNSNNPRFKRLMNQYDLVFILLIPILLISPNIFSQVTEEWIARYNGPGNLVDYAYSIAVDGSGNVYVTGRSYGSGTDWDYATIKYNSAGVQQWVQRYNGPGNLVDYAYSIAVDGSGNVYVTGWSYGSGTDWDYATIKYNSAGVQQWVQRYNGPGNSYDVANYIAVDGSGNVYVTGRSYGSGPDYDYATIKYNSAGVQQWVQRYNGPGNDDDVANSIAVDGSGNVYVTGWSSGSGTYDDYATIKYNSAGVQQWVQRYNGPGSVDDVANSIAVDGSGNVYVTGRSYGSGPDYDYATIKYSSAGAEQWVQRYNGPGSVDDVANSIAVDGSGNVYVTGESRGSGTDYDYATIKYIQGTIIKVKSPNGGEVWQVGNTYNINWIASNDVAPDKRITLWKGGQYYQTITNSTTNNGSYSWTIPSSIEEGADYKVRITSNADSSIYDYSDLNFAITLTPPITITSPNGGEIWQKGSTYQIIWTSSRIVDSTVKIELYKGGAYHSTIISNKPNDGSYIWTIPNSLPLGNDYKIKIKSITNDLIYDYSDNYFNIVSEILVISPNGGESWLMGSKQSIQWSSSPIGSDVRITLYKGEVYYNTITSKTSNDGFYIWSIPTSLEESSDYKVRITSNLNGSIFDYSDSNFSIIELSLVKEEWVARYNGPGNDDDYANSIAVDGSGNVYVTGYSVGSGTSEDYATIKYNSAGVQQWVQRYNGPGSVNDVANSIAVDGSGNVYVTGYSYGGVTYYDYDYATIKYNSAGAEEWVRGYNGPGNRADRANSIAVDGSGNVYVTGGSDGGGTSTDYATIKYNSAGVQQWLKRYNGPGNEWDWANSIAVDGSGNVYVTGLSCGSGTSYDYATIKYNSAGVQHWIERYNGPGNLADYANSIAVDGSGNVYVTGISDGSGTGSDYATIKYNSAGDKQWVQRYNGPGNSYDVANSIAVDGSGNVYVTGYSVGSGTSEDYATIKYNSQWVQRYNGPGNLADYARSIAVDGSGNVYVTGRSYGSGTGSDYATIKYNSAGDKQWVQRYNGPGNSYDYANSIAVDGSGNVYVTGESYGSGTSYDYATIKYSPQETSISDCIWSLY